MAGRTLRKLTTEMPASMDRHRTGQHEWRPAEGLSMLGRCGCILGLHGEGFAQVRTY